MTARVERLTPQQEAQFGPWAKRWIDVGLCTDPADRAKFEDAAKRVYRFADLPWHDNVIWVRNPVEAVTAGPAAAYAIELHRRGAVRAAVSDAVGDAVDAAVRVAVSDAVSDTAPRAVDAAVRVAVRDAVSGVVISAVDIAVGDAVHAAVRDAVSNASGGAIRRAVDIAVDSAVDAAVRVAVSGAVSGAVDIAVDSAVGGAVIVAVSGAAGHAVSVAVGGAVSGAVGDAVNGAVDAAVRAAVSDAVGDAVHAAVRGADTQGLARGALSAIYRGRGNYIGGQFWVGGWWHGSAFVSFFREVCGLELPGDTWDRARAYEATLESACWWWPHRDFIMVSERPHTIHLERVGPDGWGSQRLHCENGPAIAWEGLALYFWHGIHVPAWVIHEPTVERAIKEPNSEIRRAAFESLGWDKAIEELGLEPMATCPDPGNDPHELALYRLPEHVYDEPVNLLVMTNGSPDRSGELRRYGETVPAEITDPLTAAAWQYGTTPDVYAQLARRT